MSEGSITDEDLIQLLLNEQIWVNNPQVDGLEAEAATKKAAGNATPAQQNTQYLRQAVFPVLVPALHEMLKELNKTIGRQAAPIHNARSNATTDSKRIAGTNGCPYRSVEKGGQRAEGTETFVQTETHTSALRRRTDYVTPNNASPSPATVVESVNGISPSVEAASPTPFYGPTGRSHPIEFLAQQLIRNNDNNGAAGGGYAAHPYVTLEKAAVAQHKPGYW
eukprot:GILI01036183.1.p1 GENE.GILI01036183.1~~GILI01036183.1.p1  ORF type:complete len:222 (+),score=54.74 GILI01036183.1:78-743(+)